MWNKNIVVRLLAFTLLFVASAITSSDKKEQKLQKIPQPIGAIKRVSAVPVTVCRVRQYDGMKAAAEEELARMTPAERLEFLKQLNGPIKWWKI